MLLENHSSVKMREIVMLNTIRYYFIKEKKKQRKLIKYCMVENINIKNKVFKFVFKEIFVHLGSEYSVNGNQYYHYLLSVKGYLRSS